MRAATFMAGITMVMLSACSGEGPAPIRDFGAAQINSFERDVVTHQALTMPASFNTLPQPVPGARNRADPR